MAKHSPPPMIALALAIFLVVAYSSRTTVSGVGGMVGGKTKVKDVKTNEQVQELGRYSVEQYNREQRQKKVKDGGDLKFQEVVEAETQVVSGIKYYLKIAATAPRSGVPKRFDAEVVVKPWAHTKKLLNFAPSLPAK